MDIDKMVEEMIKDIIVSLGEKCLLNIGGHCRDCKYVYEDNVEHDCQTVLVANELTDKGYRKIPDGAVVLTKDEYERLKALPEKVHGEMDERMKEEIAIEKRMSDNKLERFENNMKNVLEIEKENARTETAREIFDRLMKAERGDGFVTYTWSKSTIKQLANEYGVEVE